MTGVFLGGLQEITKAESDRKKWSSEIGSRSVND